jgi:hypothetical protein
MQQLLSIRLTNNESTVIDMCSFKLDTASRELRVKPANEEDVKRVKNLSYTRGTTPAVDDYNGSLRLSNVWEVETYLN